MLSVLGGEDLSAIFGEWAKADAAENAGGIGLCAVAPADVAEVSVGAPPPLRSTLRSTAPPLPEAMANQQLEAIAHMAAALDARQESLTLLTNFRVDGSRFANLLFMTPDRKSTRLNSSHR